MQQMMILAPFSPPQPPLGQIRTGSPSSAGGPDVFQSMLMQALKGVQMPGAGTIPLTGSTGVSVPLGGPLFLVSLLIGRGLEQAGHPPEGAEAEAVPIDSSLPGSREGSAEGAVSAEALQALIGWLTALAQGAQPQIPPQLVAAPLAAAPAPMAQIEAALARMEADPQLEGFVQQVLEQMKAGSTDLLKPSAQAPAGPTFSDLVELIAGKAEAVGARAAGTAASQPTQTQEGSPDLPERPEAPAVPNLAEQQAALLSERDGSSSPEGFGLKSDLAVEGVDIRQRVEQAEQVLRQVNRTVKLMVEGGRSELRLQLHPEHLGTVAVKLVVTGGVVQATLNARDPAVRQVLQANLDQLRQRFVDQGMKVDQVHVAIGGDSSFSQFDHPNKRETWDGRNAQWQRQQAWQHDQENEIPEPGPSLRKAAGWYPGRTGARINSLA